MNKKCCENCTAYHKLNPQGGQCRRDPPKFGIVPTMSLATGRPEMTVIPDAWPVVGKDGWCEQYAERVL